MPLEPVIISVFQFPGRCTDDGKDIVSTREDLMMGHQQVIM